MLLRSIQDTIYNSFSINTLIGSRIRNFVVLLSVILFVFTACQKTSSTSLKTAHGKNLKTGKTVFHYSFEGGNGQSMEKAVIIKGVRDVSVVMEAEEKWIEDHYFNSAIEDQNLVFFEDRVYDEISIITIDGKKRTIFFEITEYWQVKQKRESR